MTTDQTPAPESQEQVQEEMPEQSFISHLVELRNRLVFGLGSVFVIFIVLIIYPGSNALYEWFSAPLTSILPEGTSMISTEPHGPFFVPFKLTGALAVGIAVPVLLYQIWAFVAPGLYKNEKRIVFPLLLSSTLLFYLGVLFAYYVVFPIIFGFFTATAPEGVAVMTDINSYMGFALKLFLAFGVAFEVPVATVLLAKLGIVSPEAMAQKRAYVVVAAFIVGMLMTPPDIFSQTFLALPVWFLFEVGLIFAKRVYPYDQDEDETPISEI